MAELITGQPINNTTPDYRLPFNKTVGYSQWHRVAADTVLSITVPDDAVVLRINATTAVFVSPEPFPVGDLPPEGSPFLNQAFDLNPPVLQVKAVTTLYFISRSPVDLVLNFYTR